MFNNKDSETIYNCGINVNIRFNMQAGKNRLVPSYSLYVNIINVSFYSMSVTCHYCSLHAFSNECVADTAVSDVSDACIHVLFKRQKVTLAFLFFF